MILVATVETGWVRVAFCWRFQRVRQTMLRFSEFFDYKPTSDSSQEAQAKHLSVAFAADVIAGAATIGLYFTATTLYSLLIARTRQCLV